jgi:hypothetical protein
MSEEGLGQAGDMKWTDVQVFGNLDLNPCRLGGLYFPQGKAMLGPVDSGYGMLEAEVIKAAGQIGGIGGIALGVMLFLFRDIIAKNIFPKLPAEKAYRLLRLITVCVWSLAVLGMGAWVFASRALAPAADQSTEIKGDNNSTTQTIIKGADPSGADKPVKQSNTVDGKGNIVVQEKIE